ncbi:MAG: aspartate--tRNA ligase, partial [Alphaproteobacteria bacterium]|nr:aspartate--tRNA ligase [Alphaproteobacteria bacterium]MBU1464323.1 aspartate--tRNA ligase [Alphaproteobacteria bacterium]
WDTMEPVIAQVFEQFADGKPVTPAGSFPRIPHADALLKYGSDKPDLRNPIEIVDVTDHFVGSGFGIFASLVESGARIRAIPAPGAGAGSRKFFDEMNNWARGEGYSGLGYINIKDGVPGGPIAKNHGEEATAKLIAALGLGDNDGVFFAAGKEAQAAKLAGLARTRVGETLDLIDKDRFALCWIVDFPFYEYDEDTKSVDFAHNPFSMPQGGLEALNTQDPLTINAYQYDMVCNGFEIASGSIRNQSPELMVKAFELVGLSQQDVEDRFGGLYRAFQYGAPPHGGMAAGVDRIVMLLCGAQNLREITLFPMNQKAEDLLMGAPSAAEFKQLRELHVRVVEPQAKG